MWSQRVNHNWVIEHICFIVDVFFPESTIIDSCLFQQFEEMQMFTYKHTTYITYNYLIQNILSTKYEQA